MGQNLPDDIEIMNTNKEYFDTILKGGKEESRQVARYEANYGFVSDTKAPNGEEIDVYVLGIDKPIEEFEGVCIAVIHRTNEDDDKLAVVPARTTMADDEIRAATHFQEQYFKSIIVRS